MKTNYVLAASAAGLLFLAGCGSPPKATKAPPLQEAPPPPPSKPGLGLSQAELLKGLEPITLERVGNQSAYLGYTPDKQEGSNKFTSLVAYGTPEVVDHALMSAALPYDEYPDPAKYPEFMVRNQKLLDTFLNNIFQGKVPREISEQLEYVKEHPERKRAIPIPYCMVTVEYDDTKHIVIEIQRR